MTDIDLFEDADRRARRYVAQAADQRVYPDAAALAALAAFDEPLPSAGRGSQNTLGCWRTNSNQSQLGQ